MIASVTYLAESESIFTYALSSLILYNIDSILFLPTSDYV